MAFYQLYYEQKLRTSLDEIWGFISSPQNLKLITPKYMGFDITSENLPDKVYEGMIISYKVSPLLGIKMDWVTEITHLKEKKYFVDEQRIGPYALWHHQHILDPISDGVIMKDIVTYQPPFAFLGAMANFFIIDKKLREIFEFRYDAFGERFGHL